MIQSQPEFYASPGKDQSLMLSYEPGVDIVLIGKYHVGKSSILQRFDSCYYNDYNQGSTIGIDYKCKKIQLTTKQSMILNIWDTAGSERYQSLSKSYIKKAHAAILVFDLTDPSSFYDIKTNWIHQIDNKGQEDIVLCLVGNKSDLVYKYKGIYHRKINVDLSKSEYLQDDLDEDSGLDQNEILDFCRQNSIKYFESSAKSDKNVKEVFQFIGEMLYRFHCSGGRQPENQLQSFQSSFISTALQSQKDYELSRQVNDELKKTKEDYDKYFTQFYQEKSMTINSSRIRYGSDQDQVIQSRKNTDRILKVYSNSNITQDMHSTGQFSYQVSNNCSRLSTPLRQNSPVKKRTCQC